MSTSTTGLKTRSLIKGADPVRGSKKAKKELRSPFSSEAIKGQAERIAGVGPKRAYDTASGLEREKEATEIEEAAAAEAAGVEAEKIEAKESATQAKRKERERMLKRKGRRATIVSSPLGAKGKATERRPMLGR